MTRADRRAAKVVLGTLAILGAGTAWAWTGEWELGRWIDTTRVSGWVAVTCLLLTLSASPLRRGIPRLGTWRRPLGISTAIAATAHALLAISGPLEGAFDAVFSWPYLRAGALAISLLGVLLVTSFPKVLRRLRIREWKALHRLVYGVAVLVAIHVLAAPFASATGAVVIAGSVVALLAVRGVPRRRRAGGDAEGGAEAEGEAVGEADADAEADAEGEADAEAEGEAVGEAEGEAEGEAVGEADAETV